MSYDTPAHVVHMQAWLQGNAMQQGYGDSFLSQKLSSPDHIFLPLAVKAHNHTLVQP